MPNGTDPVREQMAAHRDTLADVAEALRKRFGPGEDVSRSLATDYAVVVRALIEADRYVEFGPPISCADSDDLLALDNLIAYCDA